MIWCFLGWVRFPNFFQRCLKCIENVLKDAKSKTFFWFILENHFGSIPKAKNSEKQILNFFHSAIFYHLLTVSLRFWNHISIAIKDFGKNPTGKEPRDLKLEAEGISQKIALRSFFITQIMKIKIYFCL